MNLLLGSKVFIFRLKLAYPVLCFIQLIQGVIILFQPLRKIIFSCGFYLVELSLAFDRFCSSYNIHNLPIRDVTESRNRKNRALNRLTRHCDADLLDPGSQKQAVIARV